MDPVVNPGLGGKHAVHFANGLDAMIILPRVVVLGRLAMILNTSLKT